MNKVKEIGSSIKEGWLTLDKGKRVRLLVLVASILLVFGGLAYFTQRSQYTVLFSNLEDADAGAIVEDLEAQGLKYRLEDNGTTILVDEKVVDSYRIDLAVNGLMPESSTGFEIFDNTNMMTTDEDRQIMMQRALSGELERSIASLQQVEAAKVMLSLPEDSIFQNPAYRTDASASIVIQTKGSQTLSQQTIQGIASLVTGAVDRLPMENVQIVDTNGNLLSGFLQANGENVTTADFSTNYQSIQRSYEQDLEQRILALLAPVYGYNNLRIVVNAPMNFDVIEGEIIEYTAPMTGEDDENREGLIRSQEENFDGAREMVMDLLEGSGQTPVAEDGETDPSASYNHTTNYELNQETQRYVRAPGVLEAINASVIVNQNTNQAINYDQIDDIVRTALGIGTNDLTGYVSVEGMAFAQGDDELVIGGGYDLIGSLFSVLSDYWLYMAGGLVLLVLSMVILSTMKRNRRNKEEMEFFMAAQEAERQAQEKEVIEQPKEELAKENELAQQKNKVMSEKEDRVRQQAKENPELAAELMKVWLKE
ncbi:flagellar basal-body MS-ring/collar protein FliF [Alkalibacterium iburiense]|uniref:Flagellar M-ring protein n=1 Tax=Alkalibacterium iburiense TaxID=290589 RepID=A0ABN0XEG5_9LACT